MNRLYELKEMLIEELSQYSSGRLDRSSLCDIDTLAHAAKNVCKIIKYCEEDSEQERFAYRSTPRGNIGNVKLHSAPDKLYSRHPDLVGELTHLMKDAPDEASRAEFQQLIEHLEER